MDPAKLEKLKALQAQVRIGGKGTPRRKHKATHKGSSTDDKKVQSTLKKLGTQNIPDIEEANFFLEDSRVIHFTKPKVQAAAGANTFAITGNAEVKEIAELLPGILQQLGAENLNALRKLAEQYRATEGANLGAASAGAVAAGDDDVPDLVENFEAVSTQ